MCPFLSLSCSLSSFLLSLSFFSSCSSRLEWHSQDHDHGGLHLYASKHLLSLRLQAKNCSVKLQNAKLKLPCVWKIVHWRARAGNGNRIVVSTLWSPLSSKLRCCTDPWYFHKKGAPVQLLERFQTPDLADCQKPQRPVLRQQDCKEKVLTRYRYLLCILSKTVKKGQILADTSERSRKNLHTCLTPLSVFQDECTYSRGTWTHVRLFGWHFNKILGNLQTWLTPRSAFKASALIQRLTCWILWTRDKSENFTADLHHRCREKSRPRVLSSAPTAQAWKHCSFTLKGKRGTTSSKS